MQSESHPERKEVGGGVFFLKKRLLFSDLSLLFCSSILTRTFLEKRVTKSLIFF